jgi:hypothetical protein
MNARIFTLLSALSLLGGAGRLHAAEKSPYDVAPPDKRRAVLEIATQLAKPRALLPLPAGTINPFDPPGFGQPDPDERAAELAAAKAAQQPAATRAPNDRELLETIAGKIVPTGTMFVGGEPTLLLGKKAVKIGTKFTVTWLSVDYVLELIAIDRTTFTLRFNREEIIRPIKPGK